ncbi:MAG TPA: hypothetical protein VKV15_02940 [Bryobacteraceae bacterium]|nr:hypothetical protein [Bryobacteraceae bacterium]
MRKLAPALVVFVAIAVIGMWLGHNVAPDSISYMAMAQGHFDRAVEPFSGRMLHPSLVGVIARLSHVPFETAFWWVALSSLTVLLTVSWRLLYRTGELPKFLPAFALFFLPWLISIYGVYTIQDMFYAALLSIFCAEFIRRQGEISVVSLLILFLLYLTRESTLLLTAALCFVAWRAGKYRRMAFVTAVSLAGLILGKYFEGVGIPNQHGVNGITYLAMKFLYNPPQNILGMKLLVDSYPYYDSVHAQRIFELPFAIGRIRHVAFYGFEPGVPLTMLMTYLCSFGLIPVFIAASVRGRVRETFNKVPEAIQVMLLFGILCAVSAPFLGNAVNRYLAYGWPAFTLCLPYLGIRSGLLRWGWLLALHYAVALVLALQYWTPLGATDWWPVAGACLAAVMSVTAYFMLRRQERTSGKAWSVEMVSALEG